MFVALFFRYPNLQFLLTFNCSGNGLLDRNDVNHEKYHLTDVGNLTVKKYRFGVGGGGCSADAQG